MKRLSTLLMLSSFSVLIGCDKDSAPAGQVVATVDGEEITASQLDAELGEVRAGSPEEQKELRRIALQQIINRYLLANRAKDQNLADSPAGAMVKQKAEQIAYINLLQQSVTRSVPDVSDDEAKQFVLDNPDLFDRRKIFLVEQILVPTPPAALITELEPLNTLPQVQAVLDKYDLPTRSSVGVIDSLVMKPDVVRQIASLAPGMVFIMPNDNGVTINQIRETRVEPVSGEEANLIAKDILQNARASTQINSTISKVLRDGATKVRYNKAMDLAPKPASAASNKDVKAAPAK